MKEHIWTIEVGLVWDPNDADDTNPSNMTDKEIDSWIEEEAHLGNFTVVAQRDEDLPPADTDQFEN